MRRAGIEATEENLAYWRSIPDTTHSLVWAHASGRKSLVIGCHASHRVGMDRAEPYPLDSGRIMHRCTLLGEEAFS